MNGFTENRASGASERPGPNDRVLTWEASRAMLPLVSRIAQDVAGHHLRLARLQPERVRLERARRTLDWPGRRRRYQLQEESAAAEADLRHARAELEALGLTLLGPATGLVGFPTLGNDRRAFFNWKPGEDGPLFWSYAGESARRPVPASWTKAPRPRAPRSRNRPEKR